MSAIFFFENFKGFANAQIELEKPLTVLIGPNGSGKSNLIEGIELLSFIAQGKDLIKVTDIGRGGDLEIRGGLRGCARHGENGFGLGVTVFSNFIYKIFLIANQNSPIVEQSMFINQTEIFNNRAKTEKPENPYWADMTFYMKPDKQFRGIYNCKTFIDNFKTNPEYISIIKSFVKFIDFLFVLDPDPKRIRAYEPIGNAILSQDGANLSAVLYDLSQGDAAKQESLNRLLRWIQQLPEEPYEKIDFVTTPLDDVIFGLRKQTDGKLVDARLLSDGTLRTLAILTALETAREGSRIIIEEFDNGLHPSRVAVLTRAISDCCKRRDLNVLVTTHNPAALNALDEEQLDGVVLCHWKSRDQGFELVRLYDLPRYDEFLESGRLGDLVTRQVVEKYLSPQFEENRQEKAMQWLESLP